MATRMLGTLRALGTERAMVFSGDDGLDELTTTTTSTVHELIDGDLHAYTIDPARLRHRARRARQLVRRRRARRTRRCCATVLAGEKGPRRDLAVLNAAAALVVAGLAADLGAGVEMATASRRQRRRRTRARHARPRELQPPAPRKRRR